MKTLNAAVELFRECKTADDVAALLAKEGIKGSPNNPCLCPVAKFLTKHTGESVSVGASTVFFLYGDAAGSMVDLPPAVADFVALFDERNTRHIYSNLCHYTEL